MTTSPREAENQTRQMLPDFAAGGKSLLIRAIYSFYSSPSLVTAWS